MKKLFTLIAVAAMALTANAQDKTYILDLNAIYDKAKAGEGGATLSGGTKYLFNDYSPVQDIFTLVSKSNRTYRIDLYNPDKTDETANYGDYTATTRLEPNGASNSTGGRQMFVEVAKKGVLSIGAWSGTAGRALAVMPATDKTSQVTIAQATAKLYHSFAATDNKTAVYQVELEPGLYCITQDAGIYYAYVKFAEGASASIESVKGVKAAQNGATYNVAGQQVDAAAKGLVIKNGKKVVIK